MTNLQINFAYPWLLLLIIPALFFGLLPYFRVAKKYRRTRNRVVSVVLHCIVMVLSILLLSGLSFNYEIPNKQNEVLLLVDSSYSNAKEKDAKDEFVQSVIDVCSSDYKIGIVKFGYDQLYVAELSDDSDEVYRQYLESDDPDDSATDIASAVKYASGLFNNPQTSKIVLISDGIETDGEVASIIKSVAAQGTKVDTVYFPNEDHDEVQVVSVETPDYALALDQRFKLGITLQTNIPASELEVVSLIVYDNGVASDPVEFFIQDDVQVVEVYHSLSSRGMHELRFEIKNGADVLTQNNIYYSYMNLEIFENVLIIERDEGESSQLQTILTEDFKVTSYSIQDDFELIPRNIKELCEFEQVILVNIAYSDMPAGFEEILNEYVYKLGGGLFTVGGNNEVINGKIVPHAYNREDMEQSTYYKQMLPIMTTDYTPPIAVMIVVDTSASMSMGKLDAAKLGAAACLDALSDRDYCGVMTFASRSSEEINVISVAQRQKIEDTIEMIGYADGQQSGGTGGTIFSDAILRAGRALSVVDVERKHIIMVTDGNPGDNIDTYGEYIDQNMADEITMSIVTIDIDTSYISKMEETAERGGGKHHNVKGSEINTIPTIMQQDLALEAIAEIEYGEEFFLKIKDHGPVVEGITESTIPPLTGYYGTVAKDDAIVPLFGKYVPIYAEWDYGEGNVGSFMSDLNGNWSDSFINDPVGQLIIRNIVKGLFPTHDVKPDDIDVVLKTDNYSSQISVYGLTEEESVSVSVTQLELASDTVAEAVTVNAAESNRRFTFAITNPGVYEISIAKNDVNGNLITEKVIYQTFSYSQEYNYFPTRELVGEELLKVVATDGKGHQITDPVEVFNDFEKTIKKSFDPRMLLLILVIVLFLLDIAVRKFKFKWPHELIREYKEKKLNNQNVQDN